MRAALLRARDPGVNLAFLGANTGYRHIRFEPSATGTHRVEVCYKVPPLDPLYGRDDPDVTGQWRYPPDPRPESVLTGVFYRGNPVHADMVVIDPVRLAAGRHRRRGGPAAARRRGAEYDRVDLTDPTPHPIEIMTHSPVVVHGQPDFADSAYYTVPRGRRRLRHRHHRLDHQADRGVRPGRQQAFISTVTGNVLRAFARGPAGHDHPARDNVGAVYPRGPGAPAPVVQ